MSSDSDYSDDVVSNSASDSDDDDRASDSTCSSSSESCASSDVGSNGNTPPRKLARSPTSTTTTTTVRRRSHKRGGARMVLERDYSPPSPRRQPPSKRPQTEPRIDKPRKERQKYKQPIENERCAATNCAVKDNAPLLELLVRANDEERRCLLQHIDDDAFDIVCCCIFNAIWNRDLVPREQMNLIGKRLGEYRKPLVYLSRHNGSTRRERRDLLVQHGAGLPLLLSSVLPAIKAATLEVKSIPMVEEIQGVRKKGKKRKRAEETSLVTDELPQPRRSAT